MIPAAEARWIADLESRHLHELTRAEVARALRALSSTYVERRARLSGRGAFDTAGKRAAYALYYAPRRFAAVRAMLAALPPHPPPRTLVDLGAGTGAASAAWATWATPHAFVRAVDVHPWAVDEARATYRAFDLAADVRRGSIAGARDLARLAPRDGVADAGYVLSYVANELTDDGRAGVLAFLLEASRAGARVCVIEPLSRRTSPWWTRWADAVVSAGGRADEWRMPVDLPEVTRALGRAAGLDADTVTGRSLWL